MEKKCSEIFLYISWHKVAFGYSPSWDKIAEQCSTTIERAKYWVNRLANKGYIKLYMFDDGGYEIKIMIDPLHRWKVNLILQPDNSYRCESEIPVSVFLWSTKATPNKIDSDPVKKMRSF